MGRRRRPDRGPGAVRPDVRAPATASVEKYRGKTLVRGVNGRALEGGWAPDGVVVIEFESADAAKTWFHSGEYQAAKKLRDGLATFRMTVVEAPPPARAGQARPGGA